LLAPLEAGIAESVSASSNGVAISHQPYTICCSSFSMKSQALFRYLIIRCSFRRCYKLLAIRYKLLFILNEDQALSLFPLVVAPFVLPLL